MHKQVILNLVARVYQFLVGAAILSITARSLGPVGRGKIAVATTLATGIATFANLSLGQIAIHQVTKSLSKSSEIETAKSVLLRWQFVVLFTFTLVSILTLYPGNTINALNLNRWELSAALILVPLLVWEQYGIALFTASNSLGSMNLSQFIGKSTTLSVLLSLAPSASLNVTNAISAIILGQCVSACFTYIKLNPDISLSKAREHWMPYLESSMKFHLNSVGAFAFSSADLFILNKFTKIAEVGVYNLGTQLINAFMIGPQSISTIFLAQAAKEGATEAWVSQRKKILIIVVTISALVLFASGISGRIVYTIGGAKFQSAGEIVKWQILLVIPLTISAMMSPHWISRGLFKTATVLTLSIGVINTVGLIVLVPKYGLDGAIVCNLSFGFVSAACNLAFARYCERRISSTRRG